MRKLSLFSAVLFLFLLVPASITRAQTISSQKGLTTAIFPTQYGTLKIYLPEDIRPGDIISGTIIAEPTGATAKQMQHNLTSLKSYSVSVNKESFTVSGRQKSILYKPEEKGGKDFGVFGIEIMCTNAAGDATGKLTMSVRPRGEPVEKCTIPSHVLTGYPFSIPGKFDGDASNTKCNLNNQPLEVLAESPRDCFVYCPPDAGGLQTIQVSERDEQKCSTQISGVDMQVTNGKLNLLKGEKTYIDVKITGLENLQSEATLRLINTTPATVKMLPSNEMVVQLFPDIVSSGIYEKRVDIQSIKAGSFSVDVNLDLPEPSVAFYENKGNAETNKTDSVPCHPTPEEAAKAEEAVKSLQEELDGIDGKIREKSIAGIDCRSGLDKLAGEYDAAKKGFEKQKTRKEQYDRNPTLFNDKQKAAMLQDYNDARTAMENALAKWREQNDKCKKLDQELGALRERKKNLPGLIKDGAAIAEKTKGDAEKCKQKAEEEKKKKEAEEERKKSGAQPGGGTGTKPGEESSGVAGKPCPEGSKPLKSSEKVFDPCEISETVVTPCNVSEFQSEVFDKIKDLLNLIKKLKDPIDLAEKLAKVSSASKAICINVHIIRKWRIIEHTYECINGKWVETNTAVVQSGEDKYGSFQMKDGSLGCCWVFDGSLAMQQELANKIQEKLDECK